MSGSYRASFWASATVGGGLGGAALAKVLAENGVRTLVV
jgi:hypothetical protein